MASWIPSLSFMLPMIQFKEFELPPICLKIGIVPTLFISDFDNFPLSVQDFY